MTAAKAGKDMYCEKPCTKNISQSLILADTMRRTGRVFQAGTQRRNLPHFAFACELARTGKLGTLKRFKEEVREVREGFECGMAFENYQDIQVGDVIECYEVEEVARAL